ncbi:MAG: hypothetical protein QOD44_3121, partial [Solirubrobacteraceae bacterium]|nr:hypothetical protein [Solirubrobacteraceae bacterium]
MACRGRRFRARGANVTRHPSRRKATFVQIDRREPAHQSRLPSTFAARIVAEAGRAEDEDLGPPRPGLAT